MSDNKVSKSEYIKAKESGQMTPEVMDIVSRAAKFGIYDDSQETQDELEQQGTLEENLENESQNGTYDESLDILFGKQESTEEENSVDKDAEKRNKELLDRIAALEAEKLERDKLSEQFNNPQEDDSANSVLDRINSINPDDYDSEYGVTVEKVNAIVEVLPELLKLQNRDDPRLKEVFDIVGEIKGAKDKQRQEEQFAEYRKSKADEFDEYWSEIGITKSKGETESNIQEFNSFTRSLMDTFGYNENQTRLALIKLNDPRTASKVADEITKKGLTIPDSFGEIFEAHTLLDYKNGVEVDSRTGEVKPVLTADGRQQQLPSLKFASIAMNPTKQLVEQKKKAFEEVNQHLETINRGAVEISADRLEPVRQEDVMTATEVSAILLDVRKNPQSYRDDPAKNAIYQQALAIAKRGLK